MGPSKTRPHQRIASSATTSPCCSLRCTRRRIPALARTLTLALSPPHRLASPSIGLQVRRDAADRVGRTRGDGQPLQRWIRKYVMPEEEHRPATRPHHACVVPEEEH